MFGLRALALFIDVLVTLPPSALIQWIVPDALTAFVMQTVLSCVYYVLLWMKQGATIGQRVVGVRVVQQDAGGGPGISVGTGFLRWIGMWVSGLAVGLGYLWMLWDPKQQCWHDKMANTIVTRVRAR